jgi:predicted CoA-binding protein
MLIQNRDTLRDILTDARVIAVVGHSDNPGRTSYQIASVMKRYGYTIYPVNPTLDEIDGEPVYPDLLSVPEPIDIVNVFRRSEHLPQVVLDAAEAGAKVVWAQLGVHHPDAVRLADEHDIQLVMDNCIKVTYNQVISR